MDNLSITLNCCGEVYSDSAHLPFPYHRDHKTQPEAGPSHQGLGNVFLYDFCSFVCIYLTLYFIYLLS